MLTDGTESRQFLHADDCSECLVVLSSLYNSLDRNQEYHITNFEWNTVLDIANEIASNFDDVEVIPALSKDMVQKDKRNEPDEYILSFWKPKISLKDGIKKIIEVMK
jgi:nucleoside-diphosphate-sugar epimerase